MPRAWFAAAALLMTPTVALSQTGSSTLDSYRRAREVLEKAAAAHGGEAALNLQSLVISYDGTRFMRYQGFRMDRPWDTQKNDWQTILDFRNSRMRRTSVERYPKDFEFPSRQVYLANGGFRYDHTRPGVGDALIKFPASVTFEQARGGSEFDIPAFLVRRAIRRAGTLRYLGQVTEGGRTFESIAFADQNGAQLTLFFDAGTGLLARYESLRDDGVDGDMQVAVAFDSYRPVSGIPFPTRRTETLNGLLVRDGEFKVTVNTSPHDSLFGEPAGYLAPAPRPGEGENFRKLAENVWLVQQTGNRVLFVAFNDYVLVFETPLPQSSATAVMDIVRRTVPGKPIRYATFSHHHDDHGAGLRPYIAEGVTIVTTPTNRTFVEHVAAAKHTISPDTLSRAPRAPVIETFSGKRVFTDGSMTVELHELGPNSHVDEMVLAWLPRERIIFQGDLLILPDQGEVGPANTLAREFLKKVEAMGWPVETIAGVHGRVGTLADLRTAVRKAGDR